MLAGAPGVKWTGRYQHAEPSGSRSVAHAAEDPHNDKKDFDRTADRRQPRIRRAGSAMAFSEKRHRVRPDLDRFVDGRVASPGKGRRGRDPTRSWTAGQPRP